MKKHIIALINSSLCQIGIFSILLLFLTSTIFGQSPKPFNQDSLTTTKKDIIGVLPNKIKAHLHNDSSLQKNKRLSFDVIPLDHQYWLTGNTNVNFNKLKLHLSGTTRYANSYGIGNASSFADTVSIQFSYLRVNQILFRELSSNLFAGIGYNLDYHWNVETNLTSDQESKKFAKLPKTSSSISSTISVNAQFDNRKNVVNPQNGTYVNVEFRQNLTMLGSDHNWQSLSLDIRHYLKLPASSRNILALRSYNNVILTGRPPYLDMPSIGWDECSGTGRGYTPGRFSGRDLVYVESEYRFPLTCNGLLGGVVFGNAGSALRNVSNDLHIVIPGGGVGLRIKMNKYSNTNVALDFGIGIGGSWSFSFNFGEAF